MRCTTFAIIAFLSFVAPAMADTPDNGTYSAFVAFNGERHEGASALVKNGTVLQVTLPDGRALDVRNGWLDDGVVNARIDAPEDAENDDEKIRVRITDGSYDALANIDEEADMISQLGECDAMPDKGTADPDCAYARAWNEKNDPRLMATMR